MGVNKVNLVGRLGSDPTFNYIEKDIVVSRIRIAVKKHDYDADGDKCEGVNWVTVVLWNRLAFIAKNGLSKGAAVAIGGKLVNNSFVDKEGKKHYRLEVEAEWMESISKPKKQSSDENNDEEPAYDIDTNVNDVVEKVYLPQEESQDDGLAHETIEEPKGKLSIKDVKKPVARKVKSKK